MAKFPASRQRVNTSSGRKMELFDYGNKYGVRGLTLHAGCFMLLLLAADFFFKINFFKKFVQEHYQSDKRFGFRSGPTFCRS